MLVNGVPTREFSPCRGLRQGELLSPLLFNLVVELLHEKLTKGDRKGVFKTVGINKNGFNISHLQYADE